MSSKKIKHMLIGSEYIIEETNDGNNELALRSPIDRQLLRLLTRTELENFLNVIRKRHRISGWINGEYKIPKYNLSK